MSQFDPYNDFDKLVVLAQDDPAQFEAQRNAMIEADSVQLSRLISSKLSYGHSGGAIDSATEFIQKIVSGQSDFITISITQQTIQKVNNVAIVRHYLDAETNDAGKAGQVHLAVLQVWIYKHAQWRLLSRQAVKRS